MILDFPKLSLLFQAQDSLACPNAFYTYQRGMGHDIRAFQITGVSERCMFGSCNAGCVSWEWDGTRLLWFSRSHTRRHTFEPDLSCLSLLTCDYGGWSLALGGVCIWSLILLFFVLAVVPVALRELSWAFELCCYFGRSSSCYFRGLGRWMYSL